ncbi:hypothetical protein K7Z10_21020 [Bacillus licheniformis]|uniref:hypothetical protein n=1 Tax=Bacillus licheniformis TaxID=1402 RepID=UPI001CA64838|nr:hypothetical protein [Bacillus licheniformis]MBY8833922.1 hypothetical protein [Bacillus licheniformis]
MHKVLSDVGFIAYDAAKGKIMAFTYKDHNKNLTVFANDLTNDDHPQHQYRLLANSIFNAAPGKTNNAPSSKR